MSWAPPRCTTHRAARRWMVRAWSPAWRSSTRWSWRGRRCSDTARRRDEAEDGSSAGDRGYFLTTACLRTFWAAMSVRLLDLQWEKAEGSLSVTQVGKFQPRSNSGFQVCSWEHIPSPSRHLSRHSSFGIVSALHSSLSSLPTLEGARQRHTAVQYMLNTHWCTHSNTEGYFVALLVGTVVPTENCRPGPCLAPVLFRVSMKHVALNLYVAWCSPKYLLGNIKTTLLLIKRRLLWLL